MEIKKRVLKTRDMICLLTKTRHPILNNPIPRITKFALFRWQLTSHAPQTHPHNYPQSDLSNTLKNNHAGMNKISPTSVDCENRTKTEQSNNICVHLRSFAVEILLIECVYKMKFLTADARK